VPEPRIVVPDRPPPGPLAGGLLGVAAGLLLASIWQYGDAEVALAVTAVFAGLLAVLAGSQAWRPFTIGMVVLALAAAGAVFAISWYASHLGS